MVVDLLLQPIRQGMTGRQFLASAASIDMAVSVVVRRSIFIVVFLALTLFGEKKSVQAGSCQSYEAAYNLEARMREGMSLKQAKESVVQDDYSDGSDACLSAIKHEINQMPYAFPLVHRALYKRMRR